MLVWVPLCASVPFLQASFFGFVVLSSLASPAAGVEYSFQTLTRLNVSTAKKTDTKKINTLLPLSVPWEPLTSAARKCSTGRGVVWGDAVKAEQMRQLVLGGVYPLG